MAEFYLIELTGTSLSFSKIGSEAPLWATQLAFEPDKAEKGTSIECRMGDPDLLHCVVYRNKGRIGGIFSLFSKNELLFVARAQSELVYAFAMSHFGKLAANTRLGVDIYENMDIDYE